MWGRGAGGGVQGGGGLCKTLSTVCRMRAIHCMCIFRTVGTLGIHQYSRVMVPIVQRAFCNTYGTQCPEGVGVECDAWCCKLSKGRKGRWNCHCVCCHCATIPSLLNTFTSWRYSPDLVNCRSRSLVSLLVKGKPTKPLHHCKPLQGWADIAC